MRFALTLAAAAAALITAFATPAFAQSTSEAAAIEEFKKGQASANAGTNDQTITIMTAVITENKLPKEWQPFSFFYRGQAYRRLEKYNEALADFDKAAALKPDLAVAFFESGLAYASQEKWKQAVTSYDKAIKLVADNADYLYSRCVAKSWSNDNAGARDDCRAAVKVKPDFTDAWLTLGRAYEDLGQQDKAEEAYKQVLKLDAGNKEAKEGLDYIATCQKPGADCSGTGGGDAPEKPAKKKGK